MAEINNSAESKFTVGSSSTVNTVVSNTLPIDFINNTGLTLTKTANPTTFLPGEIIDYTVTITNNSSNWLSGVRIIDNLGGGNLAYVVGSGTLTVGSLTYPVTPVATNPLTFTLQQLNVGQSMTLKYKGQVIFNLPSSVTSITNSVNGIGYTSTGTITGSTSSTIQKKTNPELGFVKSASVVSVTPNQSFNYYLALTNGGLEVININSITDDLPNNFTLTSVKLKIGSNPETTLTSSQYTLGSGNLLTIPSGSGPTITVPAGGTTLVTLTGYFS